MIQKLMLILAAAAAVFAAAGVLVIALAFTLYAVMRDAAGFSPEASSAVVALVAAILILIPALVLAIKFGGGRKRQLTVAERVKTFVAERPVSAAAAAAAAGLFAIRSPKTLMALVLALLEPRRGRRY